MPSAISTIKQEANAWVDAVLSTPDLVASTMQDFFKFLKISLGFEEENYDALLRGVGQGQREKDRDFKGRGQDITNIHEVDFHQSTLTEELKQLNEGTNS